MDWAALDSPVRSPSPLPPSQRSEDISLCCCSVRVLTVECGEERRGEERRGGAMFWPRVKVKLSDHTTHNIPPAGAGLLTPVAPSDLFKEIFLRIKKLENIK